MVVILYEGTTRMHLSVTHEHVYNDLYTNCYDTVTASHNLENVDYNLCCLIIMFIRIQTNVLSVR